MTVEYPYQGYEDEVNEVEGIKRDFYTYFSPTHKERTHTELILMLRTLKEVVEVDGQVVSEKNVLAGGYVKLSLKDNYTAILVRDFDDAEKYLGGELEEERA